MTTYKFTNNCLKGILKYILIIYNSILLITNLVNYGTYLAMYRTFQIKTIFKFFFHFQFDHSSNIYINIHFRF